MTTMEESKDTHRKAFCLMWYACKCGHRERIWNSRDGVTPFGTACPSCGDIMDHVDWKQDERAPQHKLRTGQRFWRDGTPDDAEAIMRRRIERLRDRWPQTPGQDAALITSARSGDDEFRPGWPMLDEKRVSP